MNEPAAQRPPNTSATLIALVAGIGLGALASVLGSDGLLAMTSLLEPVGALWTNALRITVIPLVAFALVTTIGGGAATVGVGRLGGLCVGVFVALLLGGLALPLVAVPPLLPLLGLEAHGLGPASGSELARAAAGSDAQPGFTILSVVVASVIFGLALARASEPSRQAVLPFFKGLYEVVQVVLVWIVRLAPLGVFALACSLGATTGLRGLGVVGKFILLIVALLVVSSAGLYAVAALAGGVGVARFARAALPAQLVALSTRSSLASLPALLDGADRGLGLPPPVSRFVLPLAVTTFRANIPVTSTTQLLFLMHVYGLPLEAWTLVGFVFTMLLLSFSTPGIPSGGFFATLPAYLAAGAPLEGLVLLKAVDALPDVFKTVNNVTGDLAAAAVVNRLIPGRVLAPPP